ncbi:hypothetical protein, partial [Streptomyces longispororuber]|uniref:hypothetical protein n=1 Tax=Streptomyces longispororuber TaxID=68230 RepID=UPI003703119C
ISCFQPYQIRFPFRSRSEFISGGRWRALPFGGTELYQVFFGSLPMIFRDHGEPDPALGSDLIEAAAGPGR